MAAAGGGQSLAYSPRQLNQGCGSQRGGGRTFHCRLRLLLVRWVSFGDDGTSGTLQCVVKEPASELEPRTELYVAHTLQEEESRAFRAGGQKAADARCEAKSSPDVILCRWP